MYYRWFNVYVRPTWVKRLQPLVAAGAYAQQSGVQYWSGIPVLVGTATFREYEGKKESMRARRKDRSSMFKCSMGAFEEVGTTEFPQVMTC